MGFICLHPSQAILELLSRLQALWSKAVGPELSSDGRCLPRILQLQRTMSGWSQRLRGQRSPLRNRATTRGLGGCTEASPGVTARDGERAGKLEEGKGAECSFSTCTVSMYCPSHPARVCHYRPRFTDEDPAPLLRSHSELVVGKTRALLLCPVGQWPATLCTRLQ